VDVTRIIMAAPQNNPERIEELRKMYPEVEFVVPSTREDVLALVGDADAFFGSPREQEFRTAEQLRWVQSSSAGVEWMWNVRGIADSDVVVTNMRGAHADTIAEHAFALLLALTRAIREWGQYQQKQEWARGQLRDRMVGIKGLTMGIVGFGNIGRCIGRRAAVFEMTVLAVDAKPGPPGDGAEEVWPLSRLNDMCRQADVLAIAAPITPETRGMIGAEQIELMKDGSYLLAMSRGGIVDEPSLIRALESGKLAGAGLDVTATEPLPAGDPLWSAPNVVITPHTSPTSRLTTDLVWSIFAENIGHFLKGEPLINQVDKKVGF
jgi:phosphoglycerate dehydrogenase-like enzyme